jgi:uncharacterized CHY-type Zn-finger protein
MSRSSDPVVHGRTVDAQTRCVHYHSPLDIVAIRFFCCGKYYPCYQCHNEAEDHIPQVWPRHRFHERAILCGVCRTELSIERYRAADRCPECGSVFNPGCASHAHLYFDVSPV